MRPRRARTQTHPSIRTVSGKPASPRLRVRSRSIPCAATRDRKSPRPRSQIVGIFGEGSEQLEESACHPDEEEDDPEKRGSKRPVEQVSDDESGERSSGYGEGERRVFPDRGHDIIALLRHLGSLSCGEGGGLVRG